MRFFLFFLLLLLAGCGGEGPLEPSPEDQAVRDYRFTMTQIVREGSGIIEEYGNLVGLWNTGTLNPQWDFFSEEFRKTAEKMDVHLGNAKQVKIPTQDIRSVHALYIQGWELLLKAARNMDAHTTSRGTPDFVLQANLDQQAALKKFQDFQTALSNLK